MAQATFFPIPTSNSNIIQYPDWSSNFEKRQKYGYNIDLENLENGGKKIVHPEGEEQRLKYKFCIPYNIINWFYNQLWSDC